MAVAFLFTTLSPMKVVRDVVAVRNYRPRGRLAAEPLASYVILFFEICSIEILYHCV